MIQFDKIIFIQKRVLDRLADTPEFTQAVKSGSIRNRRTTTGRVKRTSAREATESISKQIHDEKGKGIKSIQVAAEQAQAQEDEAKQAKREKMKNSTPPSSGQPKRETQKQKRRREKRQSLQDPLSPDTKRAREDHGWDGVGDTYRRQILKPVCSYLALSSDEFSSGTKMNF